MTQPEWLYLSRTLEAGLLAAFVVLMLGLLLCAHRAYHLRVLRAGHEHRLAMMAAGAVATAQRDRRARLESAPDSTALRTAPVVGKAPRELGELFRFESYRDADGFFDPAGLDPCDEAAFYHHDDDDDRLCHCCGETFDRCRSTYRGDEVRA
ncbi:hypothetical protein N800_08615 [Lysobacter daejeonensis GH1-9]|uniref:Uncharacterized protein n=1 Tax=Lysobacter daejeonensis GH1-9 TaxID=1385517 RepID=A0A0A0EZ75_9GAMM|nr:hypothetical protein [Lysobacter daejeonensis]KGM56256.1 hypothetical protein N800_08615 [Lysobacter daejeonensis GH1-9]